MAGSVTSVLMEALLRASRRYISPNHMTSPRAGGRTVREAVFDVLRAARADHRVRQSRAPPRSCSSAACPTTSASCSALHEGALVGMASGYAIGSGEPAFVLVHTTAGLGNAVSALATARVNRAPLVVLVGQQDRRHLAQEPFLAGRLHGLAGEYPVWVDQPVRPQDVPGALARAWHEARTARGPGARDRADGRLARPGRASSTRSPRRSGCCTRSAATPARDRRAGRPDRAGQLAGAGGRRRRGRPGGVGRAGRRWPSGWPARSGRRRSARAPASRRTTRGSPATCPPAGAGCARRWPAHDLVLAVGAPVFRQYPYEPGPLVEPGTRVAVVTDDPAEAHRSPVDLAVLAAPAALCAELARGPARAVAGRLPGRWRARRRREPPAAGEPLRAGHVLAALAERLPPDTVLVEEAPSARPELHARLPARRPLGFLSAAMGGLGFGLSAPIGVRMAQPDAPGRGRGRRRLVDVRDPGALERGALRGRRDLRRARQRRLPRDGPAGRGAGAGRRRGRTSARSTSPRWRAPRAARRERVETLRGAGASARRGARRDRGAHASRCCSRSWWRPDSEFLRLAAHRQAGAHGGPAAGRGCPPRASRRAPRRGRPARAAPSPPDRSAPPVAVVLDLHAQQAVAPGDAHHAPARRWRGGRRS